MLPQQLTPAPATAALPYLGPLARLRGEGPARSDGRATGPEPLATSQPSSLCPPPPSTRGRVFHHPPESVRCLGQTSAHTSPEPATSVAGRPAWPVTRASRFCPISKQDQTKEPARPLSVVWPLSHQHPCELGGGWEEAGAKLWADSVVLSEQCPLTNFCTACSQQTSTHCLGPGWMPGSVPGCAEELAGPPITSELQVHHHRIGHRESGGASRGGGGTQREGLGDGG